MNTSGDLSPHHRQLLDAPYPRFSETEMGRRALVAENLRLAHDVDHLLAYSSSGVGGAVTWWTQWPVTREAALVLAPEGEGSLLIQFFNHVPLATRLSEGVVVQWVGPDTGVGISEEIRRRGARRVGVIGPLPWNIATRLVGEGVELVDLTGAYVKERLVKSDEEISWMSLAAHLGDRAVSVLETRVLGENERGLGARVEATFLPLGGVNGLHYFAVNPMENPTYAVPRQHPSTRRVESGDVISTEITVNFFDYGAQILRTFSVEAPLNPLFKDLHDVAEEAFARLSTLLRPGTPVSRLVEASSVIEEAGFTTIDDLVHGYGGGYLPPILGSRSRPHAALPDFTLKAGMTLVVQPNVVTRDGRAGVQTGECLLVGEDGPIRLHQYPEGAQLMTTA
ncbi:MAG: aminopeptidase P family protein [Acidimicrobiaceae bacterium]|nr:aminopeptidase P family protein [Acidimicrobiaceae bacterium]